MNKWVHGKVRYPDGNISVFRYVFPKEATPDDIIGTITTRFAVGSVVLWVREGFVPADTSEWDGWAMEPP